MPKLVKALVKELAFDFFNRMALGIIEGHLRLTDEAVAFQVVHFLL